MNYISASKKVLKALSIFFLTIFIFLSVIIVSGMLLCHIVLSDDGRVRIETDFNSIITRDHVEKYKFDIVGIGDTVHYWKLKNINTETGDQIIQKFNLKPIENNDSVMSLLHPPRWWPKSKYKYRIYETSDYRTGSIELWMPKDGSTTYLFRFFE